MTDTPNTDGWPKWSAWVVEGLKEVKLAIEGARKETKQDILRLREELKNDVASLRTADIADLREDLNKTNVNVAMLQVKAGLIGAVGGSIPVCIMIAMQYLNK